MSTPHVDAALRADTLALKVERLSEGPGTPGERQARQNRLGKATGERILEAIRAGATTIQIAQALGVGLPRAQERVRDARKAAGERKPPAPRGGAVERAAAVQAQAYATLVAESDVAMTTMVANAENAARAAAAQASNDRSRLRRDGAGR